MRTRLFTALLQASVISILLSGCLVSNTPLLTAANSDRLPLPPHSILSNGTSENVALDLADDNSYIISSLPADDKNSDRLEDRLYFKKISDNTYAYSRREIDKDTGAIQRYAYGYMRILDGNKIANHEPECSDFDPSEVKKLGVEIIEKNINDDFSSSSCNIPSVEVLETLLRSYLNDPKNEEKIKYNENQSSMTIITK
jgi:hypothetical protein